MTSEFIQSYFKYFYSLHKWNVFLRINYKTKLTRETIMNITKTKINLHRLLFGSAAIVSVLGGMIPTATSTELQLNNRGDDGLKPNITYKVQENVSQNSLDKNTKKDNIIATRSQVGEKTRHDNLMINQERLLARASSKGALAEKLLREALSKGFNRIGVIEIENNTKYNLVEPKHHIETGNIKGVPNKIPSQNLGAFTATNRQFIVATHGTSGTVSYRLEGTNSRIAITWFVPVSYISYDNGFNLGKFDNNKPTNKRLYNSYYSRRKHAKNGSLTKSFRDVKLSGTMDDERHAVLRVNLEDNNVREIPPSTQVNREVRVSDGNKKIIKKNGEFWVNGQLLGTGKWISPTRYAVFVKQWGNRWWIGDLVSEGMLTTTVLSEREIYSAKPSNLERYISE